MPFYLRTGKRLKQRYSEITVKFRRSAAHMFSDDNGGRLQIRLQPEMQINMEIFMKKILDESMRLVSYSKNLRLDDGISRVAAAYEKLLLDVLKNRQVYFVCRDEIEIAWQWIDGLRSAFKTGHLPMERYPAGSEGSESTLVLPLIDGFPW